MQNITMTQTPEERDRRVWQALAVCGIFIVLLLLMNAAISFLLGVDAHAWTYSPAKAILFDLIIYAGPSCHEMSNPEYWYGHLSFTFVFVVIAVAAANYLWRRSLVVTWLGDILSRFVTHCSDGFLAMLTGGNKDATSSTNPAHLPPSFPRCLRRALPTPWMSPSPFFSSGSSMRTLATRSAR